MRRRIFGSAMTLVMGTAASAHAYNWETHSLMAEDAVIVMRETPADATPPAGVDAAEWEAFIAGVKDTPDRLSVLRVGLPDELPNSSILDEPFPGGGEETYPFANPDPFNLAPPVPCPVAPYLNLEHIDEFRIVDFPYIPRRTAGPCGLSYPVQPDLILGKVLGWHGGGVDDHLNDTVLWFKPTNAAGASVVKETASQALTLGLGAVLLPFVCAYDAIFGDGCDPDHAFDLAEQYNPVDYIDGWLPGFGTVRDEMFTGMWHFIDVDADQNRFNDIRGLYYPQAGPDYPGVMDVAIMASADLSGLSLNAGKSDGDDLYGEFDEISRGDPRWQAVNVGHLEFSPLDNLAAYGWNLYGDDGYMSARGLGWPLHAIGDAVAPHHVVGSSSWGHRPYEDFVDSREGTLLRPDDEAQRRAILERGFEQWRVLKSHGDIQRFIEDLAFFTLDYVRGNGDWAYKDFTSFNYLMGGQTKTDAILEFHPHKAEIEHLLEEGAAATLAFLVVAGELAVDPGRSDSIDCPPDTHYEPKEGCLAGPPVGPTTPVDLDVCATPECASQSDGGNCGEAAPCDPVIGCEPGMVCDEEIFCCLAIPK
jgi:hypothetical protein